MSREAHVRFDGSGEGQFLPATLQRCGKGPPGAGQVRDEKTNVSEPLPEASIDGSMVPKPGGHIAPGTKARCFGVPSTRGLPACCPGGARCKGGVSSSQALVRNREIQSSRCCRGRSNGPMAPRPAKGRSPSGDNRKGQSTDAGHWGGAARSSDEGPVMGLEPRGCADQGKPEANSSGEEPLETPKPKVKSFEIDKRLVYQAWEKVRANMGAPGVDAVSIKAFQEHERDNLYKLWNRMASGSYFPGPVRAVEIPKDHGKGVRVLGVPTVPA